MLNYITLKNLFFQLFCSILLVSSLRAQTKESVHALYIPLADHYAALVAYERYAKEMKYADFKITQMKNWDLLRAYFQSGRADMAYVMSPMAMDMYSEKQHFKWIGLMHRDGSALAINDLIYKRVELAKNRADRKPDSKVADVLKELYMERKRPTSIAMPHILSTHSVILYKYLKDNNTKISFVPNTYVHVSGISVAPPKSPTYLKSNSTRATPAAFEQSLPWADVVETGGYGHVAWYSKDVLQYKNGHVECIAVATDTAIKNKNKAIDEVMHYIHQAGKDIEMAKKQGGEELEKIVRIVHKHIKAHTRKAIIASLDPVLNVINYNNLNVDKVGLKLIMDYAVEGKILKNKIDINSFADEQFKQ